MRTSGILLPLSSLPSPHGIGTLGRAAFDFVDFLAAAGQSWWQVLPPGPTGFGDSPYQSFSAMAGSPYLVDLDLLAAGELLREEELVVAGGWGADATKVDYGFLYKRRLGVLAKAAARQNKTEPAYLAFCRENAWWLDDYALFMAIKEAEGGGCFQDWPDALRLRRADALKAAEAQHGPRCEFYRCVQYFFFRQWGALKAYAGAQGVGIIGDIPIYVSPDSCDLWANPGLFQLGADGRPSAVAGVPPDAFSATGQLWGNPLYDWPAHKRTRYAWWLRRLRFADAMFDLTRIDHVRGFAGYYAVAADAKTAMDGRWHKGPGRDFVRAVQRALPGMRIIAEDLGFLTDDVRQLLAFSGYPGMKVLQFAFDSRDARDMAIDYETTAGGGAEARQTAPQGNDENPYLPHNLTRNAVVYTGTHDNPTLVGWQRTAKRADVAYARSYLGIAPRAPVADAMVRAALASVTDMAVVPLQDWLHLGEETRINTPSTLGGGNWCWRLLPGQLTPLLAGHIREWTTLYGRLSQTERAKQRRRAADEKARRAARVLGRDAMREAEDAAVTAGTSYAQLMENAGAGAADEVERLAAGLRDGREAPTLLMLCGKGNNAGDAFVLARHLAATGWRVSWLALAGEAFSPLAEQNLNRLPAGVRRVAPGEADFGADLLVDAVFGIGFKGELPENVREAFRLANETAGLRVALDLPSGLDCDSGDVSPDTFRADATLTFGAAKPGMRTAAGRLVCGEVTVVDIGL